MIRTIALAMKLFWPDMVHILPFFASRVPEAAAALDAVAGFVRKRVGAEAFRGTG